MSTSTQLTLFDLPTTPDEVAVLLPPANLRNIDFSALDFTTARRAIVEYIETYYASTFNDWVVAGGVVMLLEVVAAQVAKLGLRSDLNALNAFLPTATNEQAVVNLLALINQFIMRQTPAVVDLQATVATALTTDVLIPPGVIFTTQGPDNLPVYYEAYRAPGDFTSNIVIPAGKRGVIAFGIEGRFAAPFTALCPGGANQTVTITAANVLSSPVTVTTTFGSTVTTWTITPYDLVNYGPTDTVVQAQFFSDHVVFTWGDNVNGAQPPAGATVVITYRVGGGVRGRIGSGVISDARSISPQPPATVPVQVTFANTGPSSGGTDYETLAQAKARAPVAAAVANSITTDLDYVASAEQFAHPVYGAVAKAAAAVSTGQNANLVSLYVLALGPDGQPSTPSLGLKQGLATYIDRINVLTDSLEVLDGLLLPVDIQMTVVVHRNADATVVKTNVEAALAAFFDVANWRMGQGLYVAEITAAVMAVDGVFYVDLFQPADNVLPTDPAGTYIGVAFNQLIVQGATSISYFYEKSQNG